MDPALLRILVVGGNGFIGSAVCKAALARGLRVTSISKSGRPFQTAKGHTPAWAAKVDWHAADALRPAEYAHLLQGVGGVVHTLGTLLENPARYKAAVRSGDLVALAGCLLGGGHGNPLERGEGSYDELNRDSALRVCETFLSSSPAPRSTFVYISAEDIFRPLIPARYIETKREAEQRIEEMLMRSTESNYRGVYIRPSLVYHAHHRPLTAPLAALLDLSAVLHSKAPAGLPTPSAILRALGSVFDASSSSSSSSGDTTTTRSSSALESMANALSVPPIHVDHVAEAVCIALDPTRGDVRGVVGVGRMREILGWQRDGESS